MNNLQILHQDFKQSPWLDNLSRELLVNGTIEKLITDGVRGLTSNPTIFEKALTGSTAYDEAISGSGLSSQKVTDLYWQLAIADIQSTADLLLPIFTDSNGEDGYVSLEVSPEYAQDAEATIQQAHELWDKVNRPNLMIKVPATKACLPAISQLITDGLNINITLIFSLERYQEVVDAYLSGLEASRLNIHNIHSVASFFVSRVDSEVDNRLDALALPEALALKGKIAVAQAQQAYAIFLDNFKDSNPRWSELAAQGAHIQKPLWASTSTKNPEYDPLLYIKSLIAPNTVNTIPDATIALINDTAGSIHELGITVESMDKSSALFEQAERIGIDITDVGNVLETEGLLKFQTSFRQLLTALAAKMPA
jgi:transaldolase